MRVSQTAPPPSPACPRTKCPWRAARFCATYTRAEFKDRRPGVVSDARQGPSGLDTRDFDGAVL